MKKIASLITVISVFLSGCSIKEFVPRQSEIEHMAIVQMLAIDGEDNGEISLSLMKLVSIRLNSLLKLISVKA